MTTKEMHIVCSATIETCHEHGEFRGWDCRAVGRPKTKGEDGNFNEHCRGGPSARRCRRRTPSLPARPSSKNHQIAARSEENRSKVVRL